MHTPFLGENIDFSLCDLGLDNGDFFFLFLDTMSKEQAIKEKNWSISSRLRMFVFHRTLSIKWKHKPQNGTKYLQIMYLISI